MLDLRGRLACLWIPLTGRSCQTKLKTAKEPPKNTKIMKQKASPPNRIIPLALGLILGALPCIGSAQTFLELGGANAIGTETLTTDAGVAKVPNNGGIWTIEGSDAGGGNTSDSFLVSPPVTLTSSGEVTLSFTHRYFMEAEWDGGAVFVSVNGEPATYVPLSSFSSNGYVGNTNSTNGTAWKGGEDVFYGKSGVALDDPDFATLPAVMITSEASLGSLNSGDTVSVEFRYISDEGYSEAGLDWEIESLTIQDAASASLLNVDFAVAGSSGFTVVNNDHVPNPWSYPRPVSLFEIDADLLTADRYVPDVAGSVIDLNDAALEVVVLNGTLNPGDSFTLFDLTGGTTITGTPASLSLPPGIWDTSNLMVDGSITMTLLPPLYTAGADFEVNALLDTDGDDVWEDTVGTAGVEFFLDTTNGVSRVATTTATRLPFAYDFPGGLSGDTAPDDAEAGYGGGKLVNTGETGECRSFNEVGWHGNDATLEFWLKPDNITPTPTNGQVIFEDGGGSGFGLFLGNNQIYTQQDNGNAGDGQVYYDLNADPQTLLIAPATTEFIHVVLTRIGASGEVELFINGVSVGTATANNGGGWSGGDGFGLGARGEANVGGQGGGDDSTESFDGQIALFRIYNNQILTPAEVANNFADVYGTSDPFLSATLTAPFDGENIVSGTSVVASATLTDPGTTPYTVEFWVDGALSGTATTEQPFTRDLGALPDGTHEVYVKFIDSSSPAPLVATTATHTFTLAPPTDTTTTLTSSENPSTYGSGTVTATVVPNDMSSLTGGSVQFYDGGTPLGSPVPVDTATGEASYNLALLGVATHEITADYSGWGVHAASSASALSQVIDAAPLTVTAKDVFRPLGTDNIDPLPYTITGYQNGEDLASSGVTGAPFLTTAADSASPAGDYDIVCSLGTLDATNYSFTLVNGTLTVADVPDTFSVNFFVGPAWPYGGLTTDEQKENVKVQSGMAAGYGDWLTSGWENYLVPWAPAAPQTPVTLTSNKGSTATFQLKDCRNGWTHDGPRTTLLDDGNGNMMDAHVNSTLDPGDGSNKFDMEVTDIPFPVYDVIFYLGASRPQFGDGKGVIVFNGGPERAFTLKSGAFDGTFTEMVDATTPGNYIVFEGVTGSSFTTQTWGTGNVGTSIGFVHLGPFGFQIRPGVTDYGSWAENYPDADLADPDGDFDGDGMTNDDERLFGLNPTDPASVNPISVPFDPAAGTFSFTRRDAALTGKFSRVETSTDLMAWSETAGTELVAGTPDGNLVETVAVQLDASLLGETRLFVRVVQDDGILLSSDFDTDGGGFTVIDHSGGAGSLWASGAPNSGGLGGSVTSGFGTSAGCWGTDLGPALPADPAGAYTNGSDTSLVSPVIDLTNVPNAVLSFAEAIDIAEGDTLVINLIEADISGGINVIGSPLHTSTPDSNILAADWSTVSDVAITGGQPVRIEWRFTGNNSDGSYIGAYIDDVVVKRVLLP